jgi:hypothetical protein
MNSSVAHVLARGVTGLVNNERITSQRRAARSASTASDQSLPPACPTDAGQARSTTERRLHGARKLYGAEPKHRRNGWAQRSHPVAKPARRKRAGAACAKAADLFPQVSDVGAAIDVWMAGMYHRRPILDPNLDRVGVGYARLPSGMLTAALRFENATRGGDNWPVAYPSEGQKDVALKYGWRRSFRRSLGAAWCAYASCAKRWMC